MTNKQTLWPLLVINSPSEAQVRVAAENTRTRWLMSVLRRNQSAKPSTLTTNVQPGKLKLPSA